MVKSDEGVGIHVWERCGLGVAPFKFVGFHQEIYKAASDAPAVPGGTCSYCGQGIMNCCTVRDVNGKEFIVGPDCIAKVGEAGIIKAFKSSKEYRTIQAQKRATKAKLVRGELKNMLNDPEVERILRGEEHPYGRVGNTLYDYAEWVLSHAGDSGRYRVLGWIKQIIKKGVKS